MSENNVENEIHAVRVEPQGIVNASIIWLHGLGANGHDFESLVPELQLANASIHMRFIFPHAPMRAMTLYDGMTMPAWFDMARLAYDVPEDFEGINESEGLVKRLISAEVAAGIPLNRIVLAGYSQGAAVALYSGLHYSPSVAGIMVLSSFLPMSSHLQTDKLIANKHIPILQCHGTDDPVVHYAWGEKTKDWLIDHGYDVEWHSYPMQHEICFEEIQVIKGWLMKVFS